MQWWIGLLVPFLGTALGAACVFFLKDLCPAAEKVLLGLAAGVMVAASVWSLLLPALAGDAGPCPPWTAAAGGLLLGFFLLLALDRLLPEPQALPGAGRTLVLAVTLHNIPEGMAVGAALAGALAGSVAPAAALALAAGVAVQNIPEGAMLSLPLSAAGVRKGRAFAVGAASGAVEPLGGALMLALTGLLAPLLPWCLSFAAGAMLYVAAGQLLSGLDSRRAPWGAAAFAAGFTLMMVLDVLLG